MGATPSKAGVSQKTLGEKFDLEKFAGVWYELAHIKNPYQSNCDHAQLTFTLAGTGLYSVTSKCFKIGSAASQREGATRISNPNDPSKMEIQFESLMPGWLKFWIYDTDYTSYAIVGNPSGYVWILSRTATLTFCRFWDLRQAAGTLGFEVKRLRPDINQLVRCTAAEVCHE